MNKLKQRNQCLDIMKAFSCIMIVYIHSFNLYSYADTKIPYILSPIYILVKCAVPVFFIISGYLCGQSSKPYSVVIKKNIKTLLIPFIIWNIFYVIFEIIGFRLLPSAFKDVTKWDFPYLMFKIFGIPLVSTPMYNPLWFVRELFILFIFYPVLTFCVDRFSNKVLLILFLFIAIVNIPIFYNNGYQLNTSLPFFALGIWLSRDKEKQNRMIKLAQTKHIAFISLLIAIFLSFLHNAHFGLHIILTSTIRVFGILTFFPVIFYAARYIENNKNLKLKRILLHVFKYSFMIYVLHGKLLTIMQNICIRIFAQSDIVLGLEYFVLPMLVIPIVIACSSLLNKIMPAVYGVLTGGRT